MQIAIIIMIIQLLIMVIPIEGSINILSQTQTTNR